jgi:hypothetical protein
MTRAGDADRRTARARLRPDAGQRAAPRAAVLAAGRGRDRGADRRRAARILVDPGVREDVTDIVLNIKDIALKMHAEGPKRMVAAAGAGRSDGRRHPDGRRHRDPQPRPRDLHAGRGRRDPHGAHGRTGKGYVPADRNRPKTRRSA